MSTYNLNKLEIIYQNLSNDDKAILAMNDKKSMLIDFYKPTGNSILRDENDNFEIVKKSSLKQIPPQNLCDGKLIYNPDEKSFYLFGGTLKLRSKYEKNHAVYFNYNSVWVFHKNNNVWIWDEYPQKVTPSQVFGFSICYMNSKKSFLLFGGSDKYNNCQDSTWLFSTITKEWQLTYKQFCKNDDDDDDDKNNDDDDDNGLLELSTIYSSSDDLFVNFLNKEKPSKRRNALLAYKIDHVLLYGGIDNEYNYLTDCWTFDPQLNIWTELNLINNELPTEEDFQKTAKFEYDKFKFWYYLTTTDNKTFVFTNNCCKILKEEYFINENFNKDTLANNIKKSFGNFEFLIESIQPLKKTMVEQLEPMEFLENKNYMSSNNDETLLINNMPKSFDLELKKQKIDFLDTKNNLSFKIKQNNINFNHEQNIFNITLIYINNVETNIKKILVFTDNDECLLYKLIENYDYNWSFTIKNNIFLKIDYVLSLETFFIRSLFIFNDKKTISIKSNESFVKKLKISYY